MTYKALLFAALAIAACEQRQADPVAELPPAPAPSTAAPVEPQPAPATPSPPAEAQTSDNWRDYAKPDDVDRLSRLTAAWIAGLEGADEAPDDDKAEKELAALGPVADPKARVLPNPQPGPGDYRCRTVKLGGLSGMISYPWFKCRVALSPGGDLTLAKVTGSQRQSGKLYPDPNDPSRLIFLGTVAWGDQEKGYPAYGQDPQRDVVGVLERVGDQRWRLVLPWPRVESDLDIVEIAK